MCTVLPSIRGVGMVMNHPQTSRHHLSTHSIKRAETGVYAQEIGLARDYRRFLRSFELSPTSRMVLFGVLNRLVGTR